MLGEAHKGLSRCAYEVLPEWEKDFWKEEVSDIGYYSAFPDSVFDKDYNKYCLMPNGILIPHGPTDEKWTMVPFAPHYARSTAYYVINYYFRKIIEEISLGNVKDSIIFANVLAHYIEDSSHPGHIVNNKEMYQYFPPPKGKYWQLHRSLDNIPADIELLKTAQPRLLGLTVEEAIFHIINEYEKMVFHTKTVLAPVVLAYYSGDEKRVKDLINKCFLKSVELISSIWHTAHSIVLDKFAPGEVSSLKTVKLSRIVPRSAFTVDPYFFTPSMDYACDGKGNLTPLSLKSNVKGKLEIKEFKNGIAMSFGYLIYEIPPGVYSRFRVKIGLLSSVKEKARVAFKVTLDGKTPVYAKFHTKLLNCGGRPVYDSGIITEEDFSKEINVDLKQTSNLTLIVDCPGENKRTHAVWAEPVLLKKGGGNGR